MEQEPREARKEKAWIQYGVGGHDQEYVFSTEGTLSPEIAVILQSELGKEWDVMDRESRIEIVCKKPYGFRDDQKIRAALTKALEDKYDLIQG